MGIKNAMMGKIVGAVVLLSALIGWGCRDNTPSVYETIQEAAEKGNLEDVKKHLKKGVDINDKGYDQAYTKNLTALHLAAGAGHKELVGFLIEKGATVNAKAEDNLTPLHWALMSGYKEEKGDVIGTVELLIAKGADVNAKTEANRADGASPLHFAANKSPRANEIITLLIANGADVNAKNIGGQTPLYWAVFWDGKDDIIELLIAKGADVNMADDRGRTPLGLAIERKRESVVDLLKKHGAR